MMDHERLREALHAFRDGELPEPERREVAAHLDVCAGCRGTLDRWDRLSRMLRPAESTGSGAFARIVMARIAQEEEADVPAGIGWWLRPGFTLALGLAVLLWPDRAVPSTEQLLMSSAPAWALDREVEAEDVLSLVLEEEP
jgi:anti-sigma factor RsiW